MMQVCPTLKTLEIKNLKTGSIVTKRKVALHRALGMPYEKFQTISIDNRWCAYWFLPGSWFNQKFFPIK